MKPITILRRARKLLSDPKRWTKGKLARDKNGNPVACESKNASCFCAEGAIHRVALVAYRGTGLFYNDSFTEAFGFLASACPRGTIPPVYNDGKLTHYNLMRWFDRAIKLAEKNL